MHTRVRLLAIGICAFVCTYMFVLGKHASMYVRMCIHDWRGQVCVCVCVCVTIYIRTYVHGHIGAHVLQSRLLLPPSLHWIAPIAQCVCAFSESIKCKLNLHAVCTMVDENVPMNGSPFQPLNWRGLCHSKSLTAPFKRAGSSVLRCNGHTQWHWHVPSKHSRSTCIFHMG